MPVHVQTSFVTYCICWRLLSCVVVPCRRYVKKVKMEILAAIASSSNVYDIVSELTEYARDVNPDTARSDHRS